MNQNELAEWLKQNVDWDRYFSLVHSLGAQLNAPKLRFDKSDLLEQGLAKFSQGLIQWVDQRGCDHILPDGTKIEMKFDSFSLHTNKRKDKKKTVKEIRLVNTLAGGENRVLEPTFDYLLISDVKSVAVVAYSALTPFVEAKKDVIALKGLPASCIDYVCMPEEVTITEYDCPQTYIELKRQLQSDYLDNFE